jgi:membrane associated rhomboid family serine protease
MKTGVAVIWGWSISIVLVWALIAVDLQQPVWMRQHSIDLMAYGAFQGREFQLADIWKLFASQWLHVKFPHMLFNVLIIGAVGTALLARLTLSGTLALGLLGGAAGQVAAAVFQPDAYVSGASQAYLALCGAAIVMLPKRSIGWVAGLVGIVAAVILDLFVSGYAGVKPGHVAPLLIGLAVGAALIIGPRRRPA